MNPEQVLQVVPEGKIPAGENTGPSLGPDKVQTGTGLVLPSQDKIRPKLQEVEVRVPYAVIDRSVTVFINVVFLAARVIAEFVSREAVKTLVILLCPRVRDPLELLVLSGRDKRLSIELDREVRSQAEVHPQR